MAFVLRGYQENSVNKMCKFFKEKDGRNKVGIAPTGSGKSILISETVKRLQSKMLVLAPKEELVGQNYKKYMSYGFMNGGVYCAGLKLKEVKQVTFGTIQSVVHAIDKFQGYDIIIDECHGVSPALTEKQLRQGMKETRYQTLIQGIGAKGVLGLSATPFRLHRNMGGSMSRMITNTSPRFFNSVLFHVPVKLMVDNGWWSPLKYYRYKYDESGLVLNSSKNDFTEESKIQNNLKNKTNDLIYDHLMKGNPKTSVLIYADSTRTARDLSLKVPNSGYVGDDGCYIGKKKYKRKEVVDGWLNGDFKKMFNFNVFKEGLDFPELDGIMIGRPTNSLAGYLQWGGRVVRPTPSMRVKFIADYCGNVNRFGKLEDIDAKEVLMKRGTKYEFFTGNELITGVYNDQIGSKIYHEGRILKNPHYVNKSYVTTMPFGIHEGKHIAAVPTKYLKHLTTLSHCDQFVIDELRRRGQRV